MQATGTGVRTMNVDALFFNVTYSVDIAPATYFVAPTETSGSFINRNNILVNVTAVYINLANITIRIYNATGSLVNLTNSTTSPLFVNLTAQYDGTYYFNASACDLVNQCNNTATLNITLDTIFPTLNITYPMNITYTINVTQLNYTILDNNLQVCWYSLNLGVLNTSVTCGVNLTGLTSLEGSNTWRVYANDSAGNINFSSVTFIKDTFAPAINFTSPSDLNGTYLSRNNTYINVTASDSGSGLKNITIYLYNSSGIFNISSSLTNPLFVNISFLADGIYYFNASAYDNAENRNNSETRTITVDTINPLVDYGILTLGNGANVSQSNIYVNVSVTEINEANITFKLYNSSGAVNISTYNAGVRVINWTSLVNGVYYYNVTLTDLALNVNSTSTRTITLDTTAPNGTLIAPSNNTYTNVTSQNFTANLSDNLGLKNATLNIYNQTGLVNQTTTSFGSGIISTFIGSIVTLIDNVYTWFYNLFDFTGNQFVTVNNTLTIDTINPIINFTAPSDVNGTYLSRNNTYINVTVSDSGSGLKNITIYLYNSSGIFNVSSSLTNPLFVNISSLADGIYYFNASAYDNAENRNNTETRIITVDTINPNVTGLRPVAGTNVSTRNIIEISANVTDLNGISQVIATIIFFNSTNQNLTLISAGGNKYNASLVFLIFLEDLMLRLL